MRKVELTQLAEIDLLEIDVYTHERWGYAQAQRYLAGLSHFLELLAEIPEIGRPHPSRPGVLKAQKVSHVVFYRGTADGILVLRVWHKSMLPENYTLEAS